MKIKKGFILRDVAGTAFVVATGALSKSFQGLIKLNETGSVIWKELEAGADESEIVEKLAAEYDAPKELIEQDVKEFIAKLEKDGILE